MSKLLEAADVKAFLLNAKAKAEVILEYENEIREVATMVEKIVGLQRYLDFEPLHSESYVDFPEKRKLLLSLQDKQLQFTVKTAEEEENVLSLLEDYNETMNGINESLIQWEEALAKRK